MKKKTACAKCEKEFLMKEVGMVMIKWGSPICERVHYCSSCAGEIRKMIEKS
jgi:hypothetical protein